MTWHPLWQIPVAWLVVCMVSMRALDWTVRVIFRRHPPGATAAMVNMLGTEMDVRNIRLAGGLLGRLSANAMTVGRTVLLGETDSLARTINHEMVHVRQWEAARFPIVFIAGYLWHIRKGRASPYEAPAYEEGAKHEHG